MPPDDPCLLQGVLQPSGMRYYVRSNREPPGRAELSLVVRTGSVDEAEGEQGIAHMLEHLTFRASKTPRRVAQGQGERGRAGGQTQRSRGQSAAKQLAARTTRKETWPRASGIILGLLLGEAGRARGQGRVAVPHPHHPCSSTEAAQFELVRRLESMGMQFGAHQNAYTSFDETVYFMHVPLDAMREGESAANAAHMLEVRAGAGAWQTARAMQDMGARTGQRMPCPAGRSGLAGAPR